MNIEIFAAEKACEQGCSTCPMARRGNSVDAVSIDVNVQETFTLLEAIFAKAGKHYHLNYTTLLNLFPTINHPELIKKARFETAKNISAEIFSNQLQALLERNSLTPKELGFSYVPEHPIVFEGDAERIRLFLDHLQSWYFVSKLHRTIDITVRSNLVQIPNLEALAPTLFAADKLHLRPITEAYGKRDKAKRKPFSFRIPEGHVYFSNFTSQGVHKKVSLSNRVIYGKKVLKEELRAHHIHQAIHLYPRNESPVDFAIAPRGVMLMHASTAINNPVLWMSHEDFRRQAIRLMTKSNISILDFIQTLIYENLMMYKRILKLPNGDGVHNDDIMKLFNEIRKTSTSN